MAAGVAADLQCSSYYGRSKQQREFSRPNLETTDPGPPFHSFTLLAPGVFHNNDQEFLIPATMALGTLDSSQRSLMVIRLDRVIPEAV